MTTRFVTILALSNDLFCRIDGASICTITQEDYDRLCSGEVDVSEIYPVAEVILRDPDVRREEMKTNITKKER